MTLSKKIREFKFRVWSEDRKMFVMDGMSIEDIQEDATHSVHLPMLINQEECVWQQYTGLKDKNGKEIYEGDILQYTVPQVGSFKEKHATESGAVVFDRGVFWCNYPLYEIVSPDWNCTVIGNIFENPELLNEMLN